MVYLKSVLAGIAAMIVAELIVIAGGITLLFVIASRQSAVEKGGLGWDPLLFALGPAGWLVLIFAFITGFWWQYRRLRAYKVIPSIGTSR